MSVKNLDTTGQIFMVKSGTAGNWDVRVASWEESGAVDSSTAVTYSAEKIGNTWVAAAPDGYRNISPVGASKTLKGLLFNIRAHYLNVLVPARNKIVADAMADYVTVDPFTAPAATYPTPTAEQAQYVTADVYSEQEYANTMAAKFEAMTGVRPESVNVNGRDYTTAQPEEIAPVNAERETITKQIAHAVSEQKATALAAIATDVVDCVSLIEAVDVYRAQQMKANATEPYVHADYERNQKLAEAATLLLVNGEQDFYDGLIWLWDDHYYDNGSIAYTLSRFSKREVMTFAHPNDPFRSDYTESENRHANAQDRADLIYKAVHLANEHSVFGDNSFVFRNDNRAGRVYLIEGGVKSYTVCDPFAAQDFGYITTAQRDFYGTCDFLLIEDEKISCSFPDLTTAIGDLLADIDASFI